MAEASASTIANAKPQDKAYKLTVGRGLYVLVHPNGGKWWRFDYRRPGTKKRNTLSLGTYPDASYKRAKEKRDELRRLLADGVDPGIERQTAADAKADTFRVIASEWMEVTAAKRADTTNKTIKQRIEADLFPWLGDRPITELTAPELLKTLRRVENRGSLIVVKRLRQYLSQIFQFAIASGKAERDPAADIKGALKTPPPEKHHAALIHPSEVGELMRAIDGYRGHFVTCCALRLSPLLFQRPIEIRAAEWSEFDLEAAEWRIPRTIKGKKDHIVPLSTQAVQILRELSPVTGQGIPAKPDAPRYLFPNARSKTRCMSENTIRNALRTLGYTNEQMTAHGFRATARTLLAELGWKTDAIERQLSHKQSGPLKAAYDRAEFLAERRQMMQAWADYLDRLKAGNTNVVPLNRSPE